MLLHVHGIYAKIRIISNIDRAVILHTFESVRFPYRVSELPVTFPA